MFDLTMGGRTIGGLDAIDFFEALPDSMPEELKTEEFCNKYEYALNRLRYEVRQSIPIAPRVDKGRFTNYTCGQCGFGVDYCTDEYCPKCGRAIDWAELKWGKEIAAEQRKQLKRRIGESDGTTDD